MITMIKELTADTLTLNGTPIIRDTRPDLRASVLIVFHDPYCSQNLRRQD